MKFFFLGLYVLRVSPPYPMLNYSFILNGIEIFIFCKLFDKDIHFKSHLPFTISLFCYNFNINAVLNKYF